MDETPDIGDIGQAPEDNKPQEQNPDVQEPEKTADRSAEEMDPLLALRKDLAREEPEPQPEPKTDLVHRVTGALTLRKTPTTEPTFGVKTAGKSPISTPDDDVKADFSPYILGGSQLEPIPSQPVKEIEPPHENPIAKNSIIKAGENGSIVPVKKDQGNPLAALSPVWKYEHPLQGLPESEEMPEDQPKESPPPEEEDRPAPGQYRNPQRFIAYNPKQSFMDRLKSLPRVDKILIGFLVVAVIVLIGYLLSILLDSRGQQQQPVPTLLPVRQPTATLGYPIPMGLHLPGGWSFNLNVGALVDGTWSPKTSEWLVGTEIRRVIAIPWNKQLDAVVKTFEPGDVIQLDMSNGDKQEYKFQSISTVPVSDTGLLYDTHPSLALILINPDSSNRIVIIATP